jgi:hypothetical protein
MTAPRGLLGLGPAQLAPPLQTFQYERSGSLITGFRLFIERFDQLVDPVQIQRPVQVKVLL